MNGIGRFTEKECYQNALNINLDTSDSWFNLGLVLRRDESFRNKTCFTNALVADERHRNAWVSLANLLKKGESVRVGVTHFTKEQCEQTARDLLEDDDS